MSQPRTRVECGEHGARDATYVCRHLVSASGAGFNCGYDAEDPDRLWPDAWCDACEAVRASEDGWTDRSTAFAGIRLLCDGCYQRARDRNWTQDDGAFAALLTEAMRELQIRQDELFARFTLGAWPRWDWHQDTAELIFSESGQPRVIADVQFVGTISARSGTWLWSWANASILETARQRVRDVRAYGEERRYLKLASACWPAEEVDGWEMAAITASRLRALGAYRTPDEHGSAFLVITGARWAQ